MASIILADDMLTVRHNLGLILSAYDYKIVAEADNCVEAIELTREKDPDILIIDILGMNSYFSELDKEIDTFDTIEILLKEKKDRKIIVLTATPKENYLKKAILMGAKGFLVKGASNDQIIKTIEKTLKG
ncbi:MAG: response regulator transcription factor [Spirochaetes bacterium]|nr:response regulator transcription factor [Spirochaetota bacterium]